MNLESDTTNVVVHSDLNDLKQIYLILHQSLSQHPELMDNAFLEDLQTLLHQRATAEGVDGTDHGAWENWLRTS